MPQQQNHPSNDLIQTSGSVKTSRGEDLREKMKDSEIRGDEFRRQNHGQDARIPDHDETKKPPRPETGK